MKALYLVGGPGVGKSEIMSRLTARYTRVSSVLGDGQPRREWLLNGAGHIPVAVELGARAGRHPAGFPGTDAMAMTAIVSTEKWILSGLAAGEAPLLLGEGARLGVRRFLEALLHERIETHVVLITAPKEIVEQRCVARGSNQKESWMRGQFTRSLRFHEAAFEMAQNSRGRLTTHALLNGDNADLSNCVNELAGIIGWKVSTPSQGANLAE